MSDRHFCAEKPNADATKTGVCLGCRNEHGCQGALPCCLQLEREPSERWLSGRILMVRRGLLMHCPNCGWFKRCWDPEELKRAQQDNQ